MSSSIVVPSAQVLGGYAPAIADALVTGLTEAKADIDAFGVSPLSTITLKLTPASFVAGQGTGADTNGTPRVYNLGAALPAGVIITDHMLRIVTACTGNTTLVAEVGATGHATEMVLSQDMMAAAGYYAGTLGAAPDSSTLAGQQIYTGAQLIVTVTPDAGSKVSACTVGEFHVTVFYRDATGL